MIFLSLSSQISDYDHFHILQFISQPLSHLMLHSPDTNSVIKENIFFKYKFSVVFLLSK
jgi:hypothetical protein